MECKLVKPVDVQLIAPAFGGFTITCAFVLSRFGPLINYWTTRFEAKHKYFKQLAHVMGNFTNICYSLATRHQLYQCYLSLNRSKHPNQDVEIGLGTL